MLEIREKQISPGVTKYLVYSQKEKLYICTELMVKYEAWVAPEIGEWLCDGAESRQLFDEIKHRQNRNEVADVARGV